MVSPAVAAPASISVTATSSAGIIITDATVAAFLAGATATDNIEVVWGINNDAPCTLPAEVHAITFTATDEAGNAGTAKVNGDSCCVCGAGGTSSSSSCGD